MPAFDLKEYETRLFPAAVERYNKSAQAGEAGLDLFSTYGLRVDVARREEIQAALDAVHQFLHKKKQQGKGPFMHFVGHVLSSHEQNRAMLLDDAARARYREALEQKQRSEREARWRALDEDLRLLVGGRGFIEPSQLQALLTIYIKQGLTEADVRGRVKVTVREPQPSEALLTGLPASIMEKISTDLAVVGKPDLYDYIRCKPGCPRTAIEDALADLMSNSNRTAQDERTACHTRLQGYVKSFLLDADPEKYLLSLDLERAGPLRERVRLLAASKDAHVSAMQFQELQKQAAERGIQPDRARMLIQHFARECRISVSLPDGVHLVVCPHCFCASEASADHCAGCGRALHVACPRCARQVATDAAACAGCGFVMADLLALTDSLGRARSAMSEGDLAAAWQAIASVEKLAADLPDSTAARRELESRTQKLERLRQALDEALTARRLLAARSALADLRAEAPAYRGRDGVTLARLAAELDERLEKYRRFLEQGRSLETQRDYDEAVLAYEAARGLCVDDDEPLAALKRCPPPPPARVRAILRSEHVDVEWDLPPTRVGSITYRVVRREGSPPCRPDDGETVGHTAAGALRDEDAPAGRTVFYGVSSDRGGACSPPAVSAGLLVAREVSALLIQASDGMVGGSWRSTAGTVRVARRDAPSDAETPVPLDGPHAFVDRSIVNGRAYVYRVFVEYLDACGKKVVTPGLATSVRPAARPDPVSVEVESAPGGRLLRWDAPSCGTVAVYRCSNRPTFTHGQALTTSDLQSLGRALQPRGLCEAIDDTAPGTVWYLPVTRSGDAAVTGTARRCTALPEVGGVVGDDFGGYLQVRWQWPADCPISRVAWRSDRFPVGPDDPLAEKAEVSRGQYERDGGFRLESPGPRPYRFHVFAGQVVDGETVFGTGRGVELRAQAGPRRITYGITRGGLLQRGRFTICFSSADAVDRLPDVVVVARRGDLPPLRSEDGMPLAVFKDVRVASNGGYPFELGNLRAPLYLKAFFADPAQDPSFVLIDPPPQHLRVR